MINLTLPFPPSTNTYYRNWNGRMVISTKGRAYRELVADTVRALGHPKETGRVFVDIVAHPPDKRRRDLDNMLKCVLDALTKAGVWEDDSQIDDLRISRGEVVPCGLLKVRVYNF